MSLDREEKEMQTLEIVGTGTIQSGYQESRLRWYRHAERKDDAD